MFSKRIFYVFFFFFTALISCKQASDSNPQNTQDLSSQNSNASQVQGIPSLGLAGTYSTGISLGDADFVVIRDCDPTGKQCKNDILTSDDAALGNTVMMDIPFKDKDPNFIQTIACLAKSKITSSTNIDQDFPKDMLGTKHVVADFKINGTVYTCVVALFAKSNLPAWVASQVDTSTSTQLALADSNTNEQSNSGLNSMTATAIGASVGFAVGFLGGVGFVKYMGARQVTKLKNANEKAFAVNRVLITDFDGTLGLGDYDPHPTGYGKDSAKTLVELGQWEDFCKRKLGGNTGLKELVKKYPQYAGWSSADIIEHLSRPENKSRIPELAELHTFKDMPISELVNKGHMVVLNGKYYNAPTWLNGAVEMLHGHIAKGTFVIFNSTNFRRNVASGIEESLAQEMKRRNLSADVRPKYLQEPRDYRANNPTSAMSRWERVYIGTAAVLGIGPRTPFDKLNAIIAGIRVRIFGDKAEIGRRVLLEAMHDVGHPVRIAENAQVVSIDDKPGKAKEFAAFLSDVGVKIKHIFIRSSATTEKSYLATDHIKAAANVFNNGAFEEVVEGRSLLVTDDAARGALATQSKSLSANQLSDIKNSKVITPEEAKASGNNIKSGLAGIIMGAVLGGVGGILGNQLSH